MHKQNGKVLVIGASGYIGSQLVPKLLKNGCQVSCLVRDIKNLKNRTWIEDVNLIEGDVFIPESLESAFQNVNLVYFLMHSMSSSGQDFADLDRKAAQNVGQAASNVDAKQIIYLGGLGRRDIPQSAHLKSRHEVGDVLRSYSTPVTELRAAVIIGTGSFSFELIHHLTNRLPVMICPRWVVTDTQPISITDVLNYLVLVLDNQNCMNKIIDIGGPEILSYRDMMLTVAKTLKLRRWLIKVPVLTPKLSSYWLRLVTPLPVKPARALIEGLRHATICENNTAKELFSTKLETFEVAVKNALAGAIPSDNIADEVKSGSVIDNIESSHILKNIQKVKVKSSAEKLFQVICGIGGQNGWYYADWLWKLRGMIDKLLGGVGLRRKDEDNSRFAVGETLDFWRIIEFKSNRKILLRAEMKIPGKAWLEFQVKPIDDYTSLLVQTNSFYPRGLTGILYWYSIYFAHIIVFRGLASAIAKKSEKLGDRLK